MTLHQRTWVTLLHHPVLDRNQRIVTTAITNLDIHDIARATRTFDLAGYILVSPVEAQRELAGRIVGHWTSGAGREHNLKRTEALSRVSVVSDFAEARAMVRAQSVENPYVVATGARPREGVIGTLELGRRMAETTRPLLLVFGTGWGLAEEAFSSVDAALEPILGPGEYNHLSVRAAVAIVLDRLFGNRSDHV